ncbi:hypothetical protein PR202_gb13833 [Eleusine coracana subsp. coracana]|uniref:PI-PLC X domain-containing protein n=1 Tax=Eleusine coracana subsp. coracana TaxID=191504 RepID=A0AAV5ERK5_ELECO|nr:hypothetical protein PR202_gb13833 [Eleusine coracana subsp. coracana]
MMRLLLVVVVVLLLLVLDVASSAALVGETCSSSSSCGTSSSGGLRCTSCIPPPGTGPAVCARTTPIDPISSSLPFNRYSWLTTHNSLAVVGTKSPIGSAIISPPNQEDSVTSQLNNGVRGLMLDAYDFNNDVWLCHSFNGKCFAFTAYQPALSVLKEIGAFLESNPSAVITIFLEDYTAAGSLGKVMAAAGLTKFLFPVEKMPKKKEDKWPLLRDMIAQNHRLLVFTSKQGKEATDGLAFQWTYVVETQYGSDGLAQGQCRNRGESRPMDSKAQSLVLMNFFTTNPSQSWACGNNSSPLVTKLKACYQASANRWPNFIAVDFYMANAPFGTYDMRRTPSPSPSPSAFAAAAPPKTSPSPAPSSIMSSAASRRQVSEREGATTTIAPAASSSSSINNQRSFLPAFILMGLLVLLL